MRNSQPEAGLAAAARCEVVAIDRKGLSQMVPPTLTAHLDLITRCRFAALSKRAQFGTIGHQATGLRKTGAKGEGDGY